MWVFIESECTGLNLDHVSRLYVESTGAGAALKADYGAKTLMVGYYTSKPEAVEALNFLLEQRAQNVTVARLRPNHL
jgi:hypothetical protein